MSIRLTFTYSKPSVICICIMWSSISSAREPRAADQPPQPVRCGWLVEVVCIKMEMCSIVSVSAYLIVKSWKPCIKPSQSWHNIRVVSGIYVGRENCSDGSHNTNVAVAFKSFDVAPQISAGLGWNNVDDWGFAVHMLMCQSSCLPSLKNNDIHSVLICVNYHQLQNLFK